MAKAILTNNAVSLLVAALTTTSTSASITPGDGAKFPALSGGDWFWASLFKSDGVTNEIVKVTARATDVFTILRAQDNTSAIAWSAGERIELRIVAVLMNGILADIVTATANAATAQTTANTGVTNAAAAQSTANAALPKAGGAMTGAINLAKGAAVASVAAPDIWSGAGNLAHITGATTITGFTAAPQAGARRTLIFDAATPLTASANLQINGVVSGGSVTVDIGDQAEVIADTTTIFRVNISKQAVVSAPAGKDRQTVQYGTTNAAGYAGMLSAGAGLAVSFDATVPMRTAFAQGALDFIATLSANNAAAVTLPPNVLSFIAQDYVSLTAVTWSSTLAPRQEGNTYNQAAQSVLQFGGAAGSTTFLDDFGSTWAAQGGAKVQTNQVKFGSGALGGGGTANAMNGTTDYLSSTAFTRLSENGWARRCWAWPSALGTARPLMCAVNTSGFGMLVSMNTAGKLLYSLSSNGSSWDIVFQAVGSQTMVAGAYQFVEVTRDKVTGNYYGMINGAIDCLIATSSAEICATTTTYFGFNGNFPGVTWQGYIDKPELLPYCQHPAGTTYTVPAAAPNVATQGYASDWENKSNDTVYQVSGASTGAGINPTFTAKNRVYVGEATTGASTVSNVVNYAFKGYYDSGYTNGLPAANIGAGTAKNHFIGTDNITSELTLKCISNDSTFLVGDTVENPGTYNGTYADPMTILNTRLTASFSSNVSGIIATRVRTGNANSVLTPSAWAYKITAKKKGT